MLSLLLLGTFFVLHSSAEVVLCWQGKRDPANGKKPSSFQCGSVSGRPNQYCMIEHSFPNTTFFKCRTSLIAEEKEYGECKDDFSVIPCQCQKDNCNVYPNWNETVEVTEGEDEVVTTTSSTTTPRSNGQDCSGKGSKMLVAAFILGWVNYFVVEF